MRFPCSTVMICSCKSHSSNPQWIRPAARRCCRCTAGSLAGIPRRGGRTSSPKRQSRHWDGSACERCDVNTTCRPYRGRTRFRRLDCPFWLAYGSRLTAECRPNRAVRGVHVPDLLHPGLLVDGLGGLGPRRLLRCLKRLLRYRPPYSGRRPPTHLRGRVLLTLGDD